MTYLVLQETANDRIQNKICLSIIKPKLVFLQIVVVLFFFQSNLCHEVSFLHGHILSLFSVTEVDSGEKKYCDQYTVNTWLSRFTRV